MSLIVARKPLNIMSRLFHGGLFPSFLVPFVFCVFSSVSVLAEVPSAGTVLQQTIPAVELPSAQGEVIKFFAPKSPQVDQSLLVPLTQIVITGNTLLPTTELAVMLQQTDGQVVSLGGLYAVADSITALYKAHGYPLAYAYLPAQQIQDGVVTVAIVEVSYDEVTVAGESRLTSTQASRTLGLKPGENIEQASLERGLLLLNQTPGIQVAGTLIPGARAGTSTLTANLKDTPLLRGILSLDNGGSTYTGRNRALTQISLDNPLGYGSQVGVNALGTASGYLRSVGANFLSPNLWNGVRLGLYGSHTDYTLKGAFAALKQEGGANQLGISATAPLILRQGQLLSARFDMLRDRFNQQSSVVGFKNRSHINLARFTLNGSIADERGGVTSGGLMVTRGDMQFDSNSSRQADATGPNTQGHFWSGQLQVQRSQILSADLRLRASISGQWASRNLDGSQKFYLGGPGGVMSYRVGEGGGDQGVLVKLRLGRALPLPGPGAWEGGLLLQGGIVWLDENKYAGSSSPNHQNLGGGGIELNYEYQPLRLQLAYVRSLENQPAMSDSQSSGEFWATLTLAIPSS
jgi:hemolysin activation/secretion protein